MPDLLESRHLKLPYLAAAQAQKHVTHNEALRRLDALVQLAVIDSTLAAPPGSPAAGDRYIVADDATGAWADHDGEVASFVDGAWEFAEPEAGWLAFDRAAEAILVRRDEGWATVGSVLGIVDRFGVNATPDATNRLAVRSAAVLFAAIEDADGGSGDIRFVVNKEADGDTASLLFQSGWSGRAEVGLAGDTDFVFKVSADGSSWIEAIRIDKDTGLSAILYDNGVSGLSAVTVQDAIDEIAAGGGGGGGAVASVFGRTGAVAAAAGDYAAGEVDNDSSVSGATVKDALDALASGKQAADADLVAIAALAPSNDDLLQRKAGAWTNRTPAELKADLALAKGDVGLSNVTNDAQLPLAGGTMSGNIAFSSTQTVDGRDLSVDGTKLDGIEAAADVTDAGNVGAAIHGAGAKTTPVDADTMPLIDSAASNVLKKVTWANLKATLKTYLDTLYQVLDSDLTTIAGLTATTNNFIQAKSSAWASRTPTQVTADLINVVGDGGSGGTKGLVPAPGSGDAAAGKFLKADGTWAVPAGGGGGREVGEVVPYAGASAPANWLFCFGQNVSRSTYSALFAAIGTTFGAGDGSTTFGLPDLRGRVVAGQDDMGGTSANRLTSPLNGDTMGAAGGAESSSVSGGDFTGVSSPGAVTSQSFSIVQPTLILNYMIYAGA